MEAETGEENTASQKEDVGEFIGFLKTALLIFAGVALFVAAFLIFNTFSITVAQRTREFAMLRTLGASRRQLVVSVVIEALVIGLIASVLGLLAGIGFAPAINALFQALEIDLPNEGTVIATRTIVVSLVIGVGLTVLASLIPALRITRVPPVAGLREGAVLETPRSGRRTHRDRHRDHRPRPAWPCCSASSACSARARPGWASAPAPSSSAWRCSARSWCGRWPRWWAGRWSASAACPGASRARTPCATPAAPPPRPPR